MSFQFTWTQDLSVGNVALDQEHQRLLSQVNVLIDAIVSERGPVVVAPAVEFLNTYIDEHFADEERYMRENEYPDVETHIALHDRFREQYTELKKKIELQGPSEDLLLDIENKLARWWIEHIGVQDKKYAVFIALRERNK
jgi:hemerythrin